MMVVLVLIAVVGGLVALSATVRGFARTAPDVEFVAMHVITRTFRDPLEAVMRAYETAATKTPGMHVIRSTGTELLIDSKPTVRVMNGDFGSNLRIRALAADGGGTSLHMDYAPKFTMALVSNYRSSFVEKERALRMCAKQHGSLVEHT